MDGFRRWALDTLSGGRATPVRPDGSGGAGLEAPAAGAPAERDTRCGFRLDTVPGVAGLDRDCPPEAAVYEALRLDEAAWRHGFVAFLRHRHEAGPAGDGRLAGAGLAGRLAVARDARVLRKTRAVMEAAHRGRTLSLAGLAQAGDDPVEDRRKREVGLRERVLWPMDELGAWDVVEVPRTRRPAARGGVLRYEIGAGPELRLFDRVHYRPWLLRQLAGLGEILGRRSAGAVTRAWLPGAS